MARYTFRLEDITGDTRLLARSAAGYDWNYHADAEDELWGAGADFRIRWSTGDADNHSAVLGLGDSNQGLHITDVGAIATDWNIAATTHPNVYIHSNTTPATDYLRLGNHDGTVAEIDVVGGTTLRLFIAGANELDLTAAALSPSVNDGNALGTTSLGWADVHLATGAVLNYANGNVVLTHSAGLLTLGTGNLTITNDLTVSGTLTPAVVSNTSISATTDYFLGATAAGAVTSTRKLIRKLTGIADNSATAVWTVTVPNANHAAAVKLTFLASNGGADAFESARVGSGLVVVARTTGVVAVVTAATLDDAAIATVAAGATHTLAYSVSAVAGGAGASNTFDIEVTIDDSGNIGGNQVVCVAELVNAEATGVTIAAA